MSATVGLAPGAASQGVRRRELARSTSVVIGLSVATFVVFCVSISVGDFPIPLRDVVPAIVGVGTEDAEFIVRTLRLPRALTGLLVGASFGVSGAIFQSLARNPLASPDIIGIDAGASAAAVFCIVLLGLSAGMTALGALAGALVTAFAIYLLAWKGGVSPYRLVLVGIGIAALLSGVTQYLLTRAEIFEAQRAVVWLTGSLNGRGWEHVRQVATTDLLLLPVVVALIGPLRILQLGDDAARGLGVAVERSRLLLVIVGVALAALATAAAGPVVFVAFVSAPIARRLTGSPLAVGSSALVGALLVLLSDLVARRAFAPTELPVGVVTGVVGAPYLLWLLARSNRVGRGG
ncbi:MAG TPA: iron chelate uptake ABC transporter family permease subunit [Ilumatobacteraceae bacterium]|nr:iron chelate uptake ABC transporter family permease subunit [Ilumatobacteraceae bacterium]